MDRKQSTKELIELGGDDPKIILMSKFSPVPYAEKIMREFKFIKDRYGRFWIYDTDNGIWKEDAEEIIRLRLRSVLLGEEQQKNNYAKEVVEYIRDLSYNSKFSGELDKNLIPFQNCIYDIDKDLFLDFSPEYFVTNKLPIKIDSMNTECNIIDSFFDDIVGKEMKPILYDIAAYCLYRGYPYQKLFFLFGAGKNGKSTYLELLRAFLGNDNVSSSAPHDICSDNRFALSAMWNKCANISSDISYDKISNVNRLKEITGGDTVTIERKYKESFPARIYAKQIFSTNQVPIVEDKSDAWFRRVYLVEFPNKIENPDREILNKLTSEKELSGFAWVCIKYLKAMKKRGFIFTLDINEEKIKELYEHLSNPLESFLEENTSVDPNDDTYIFKYEFKQRFTEWLAEHKKIPWNDQQITREMKNRFRETKVLYKVFGQPDKRYWAWSGLKWNLSNKSSKSRGLKTLSIYITSVSKVVDIVDIVDTKTILTRTFNDIIQKIGENNENSH